MLKKHSIKSYALIVGLATLLALPITAIADRAADRAMGKDGFGLDSTRGNNSVAESLRQADGHPAGAPAHAPGTAPSTVPGTAPGTTHGAPGMHPPMGEDCAAMPTPTEVASCWDRQNHSPGLPGTAPGTAPSTAPGMSPGTAP